MSTVIAQQTAEGSADGLAGLVGLRPHRFTVKEYDALIDSGLLPEDASYELIDGIIVDKHRSESGGVELGIGPRHNWVVHRLGRLTLRL